MKSKHQNEEYFYGYEEIEIRIDNVDIANKKKKNMKKRKIEYRNNMKKKKRKKMIFK